MLRPVLQTRMEQRHRRAGVGVDDRLALRLFEIATWTGPGEVVQIVRAAINTRPNMFDVKGRALERLVHAAVFAAAAGALLGEPCRFGPTDGHCGFRPTQRSAWARNRDI